MKLKIEEPTGTRHYVVDQAWLYNQILPRQSLDWLPDQRSYWKYYPEHPYSDYLWNEFPEAMGELKKYLIEHDLLDVAILWSVIPCHLCVTDPARVTFARLVSTSLIGTTRHEKRITVPHTLGSGFSVVSVDYYVRWHQISNAKRFVQHNLEACIAEASLPSAAHQAIPHNWFDTELEVVEREQKLQAKKECPEEYEMPVPTPGYYRHHRGGIYRVITIGENGDTNQDMVVFESLMDQKVWVRLLVDFRLCIKKDGLWIPRFERLDSVQDHNIQGAQNGK